MYGEEDLAFYDRDDRFVPHLGEPEPQPPIQATATRLDRPEELPS